LITAGRALSARGPSAKYPDGQRPTANSRPTILMLLPSIVEFTLDNLGQLSAVAIPVRGWLDTVMVDIPAVVREHAVSTFLRRSA
jgi:hypothetical protein